MGVFLSLGRLEDNSGRIMLKRFDRNAGPALRTQPEFLVKIFEEE
jgi:hypothetical protein